MRSIRTRTAYIASCTEFTLTVLNISMFLCFLSVAATLSEWSTHYGYLDTKPTFTAKGTAAGEIHFKISIKHAKHFWLCGSNKESLLHAEVHLDANAKGIDGAEKASYTPGADRVLLTKVTPIGNECREYSELPAGNHVISVASDKATPDHVTVVTHLILWH